MSDNEDDDYKFSIVKFIKKGRKNITKEVDIVPSSWIEWNKKLQKLEVPFLSPPYKNEDFDLLHDMVKNECEVPESWEKYKIEIVGHASMYNCITFLFLK